MEVTATQDRGSASRLGSPWVIGGVVLVLLLLLGWRFLADPSLSAPTRDPAWYTWRAQVILDDNPARVTGEWGPDGLFAGGYRITVPLAGALLQQVAGIDRYSFSAFLMIGIPILTALALAAALFRSRRDPLVVLTTLLATVALFLTTPYVGYLDNITVLFLLSLTIPFVHEARTSWGARIALFLIGVAAAFTHPTTCVVFGVVLMAVFGFHFLTSRFSLGSALKADGPMLLSVGFGMIVGLASWVLGVWGQPASLAEAALPPPYTSAFFTDRLVEWVLSLQPVIIVPFIVIAIVSTIWLARTTRQPARTEDQVSIWWLLAFAGTATVLTGAEIPYYRFMNASAAPMALVGLGSFIAIRWCLRRAGAAKAVGVVVSVAIVASLGYVLWDGLQHRWVSERNQWANQDVRTSLAAVHEVVEAAGDGRANVLLVNFGDTDDPADQTNTGYGWAKTYTNVYRTGLPGDAAERSTTYFGTLEDFLAQRPTTSTAGSTGYDDTSRSHWCETFGGPDEVCDPDGKKPDDFLPRLQEYPEDPVVILIGQYYGGLCNGIPECSDEVQQQRLDEAFAQGIEIGPDVVVIQGDGFWTPPAEVVADAQAAAEAARSRFENHPGPLGNPAQTLLVIAILALLLVVPGWLAAPWLGIRSTVDRIALIPGMSVVLLLLSGIALLSVWRGSLTTAKGWVVVVLAIGLGGALRVADGWLRRPLDAFAGYFDRLFAQFSNFDFSVLMGTQYLVQMGQGVVQGAIATSIAFGGQEGFDVQNLPSATYLLEVVLALYVPYTLLSPFIGVFIDRFQRRRVVWWGTLVSAVVATLVAVTVLLPLHGETTEGEPVYVFWGLVLGLLAVQGATRLTLAVKSAALPDVLSGKDLLQGNGLSQAGGGFFQIVGIVVGGVAAGVAPPFLAVVVGAAILVVAGVVALRLRRAEVHAHLTTFGQEVARVFRNIVAGLREVAARPPAALGLSAFQMLRYQFWGFGLFTFGLYSKNLVVGGDAESLSLVLSGVGGLLGGALGVVVAQRLKDRVAPVRLLVGSMVLLGIGTLVGGLLLSVAGFAIMLFVGFFSFFLGKISADTITQQAMPDDFRGRAFALFDIAYNLGYIVPALILYLVWEENSDLNTRAILLVSGALFLALTLLVAGWARRIHDQFATQDDLVGPAAAEVTELAELAEAEPVEPAVPPTPPAPSTPGG
jgi:MFS family permease